MLAVGQSEHVRLWACRQLRKAGFTVITTDDGVDALILAHGDPPDLILTDDDVGRLDVRHLLTLLRRDVRTAGTPVLLITPRTDGDFARDCRALGATLVVKPGVRSPAASAAATVASVRGTPEPDDGPHEFRTRALWRVRRQADAAGDGAPCSGRPPRRYRRR